MPTLGLIDLVSRVKKTVMTRGHTVVTYGIPQLLLRKMILAFPACLRQGVRHTLAGWAAGRQRIQPGLAASRAEA